MGLSRVVVGARRRRCAAVALVGVLGVLAPSVAHAEVVLEASTYTVQVAGCTAHLIFHLNPWGAVEPCDHSMPPPISPGGASERHSATEAGSFDLSASAYGGTELTGVGNFESWVGKASAEFDGFITTDTPARTITLLARYRIDVAGYEAKGGGDLGAYGHFQTYANGTAQTPPCSGGFLRPTGETEARFYEGTTPGTYEFRVDYACDNGAQIGSGVLLWLNAYFVAYAQSAKSYGEGTADVRGQIVSYTATLS
jgi:hypothetical protein